MRAWAFIALAVAGAAVAGSQVAGLSEASSKRCERYCVTVEPRHGDTETIFKFIGRGWRPKQRVFARYGVHCQVSEEVACTLAARLERFRTDTRGRFVFRFRNAPGPRHPSDIARPGAQGGGPVAFRQWRGTRLIQRTPGYCVNGETPGLYPQPC